MSRSSLVPVISFSLNNVLVRVPVFAALLVAGGVVGPLSAQGIEEATSIEEAKFRWGPLGMSPHVQLTNLGIDTNVFNAEGEPERDFTATLTPGVDSWLRFGAAQLSLSSSVDWTYFRESAEQRWFGHKQDGRVDLLFNRLNPYVSGHYLTTRQRPNLEIDLRVRQRQQRLAAGARARLGARFTIDVEAAHALVDFDDTTAAGATIAGALNRETREGLLKARVALTPLTSLTMDAAVAQDRFEEEGNMRDSDSLLVLPGFELEPLALISGRASAGFKQFDVKDPAVPDYSGVVAWADVSYIAREMTRFTVAVERDVDYSVEEQQPYSVVTSAGLTVTQVVGFNWFVIGRLSRSWLAYQSVPGGAPGRDVIADRRDEVTLAGAGISRRLGDDLRLGFDVNHVSRRSPADGRDYDGYRLGGTISYGTE